MVMKSHKELDEQLEILSQIKDKEFTYEVDHMNFEEDYLTGEGEYDFSIVSIRTKSDWLDLSKIKGIEGLQISLWGDITTAVFSVNYWKKFAA
jgi:hypothetical protein